MDFEQLKEEICDHYCKWGITYLSLFKDPDIANEKMLNQICCDCPLNKYEGGTNEHA